MKEIYNFKKTALSLLCFVLSLNAIYCQTGFTISLDLQDDELCADAAYDLEVQVTGGLAPYSFTWEYMTPQGSFVEYLDGSIGNGVDNSVLTIIPQESDDGLALRAVITESSGQSLISSTAHLEIRGGIALTCNNHVNYSLGSQCDADFINPSQFIEGKYDESRLLGIEILDFAGNPIPNDMIGSFVGEELTYVVTDSCSNNKCWGTVRLEDKLAPDLICGCPITGSTDRDDYRDECLLKCYQKDLIQNGIEEAVNNVACNLVQLPSAEDNCTVYGNLWGHPDLEYADKWIPADCGSFWLQRTFILFDNRKNFKTGGYDRVIADECTYEYYVDTYGVGEEDTIGLNTIAQFNSINDEDILLNTLFLPVSYIELGCDAAVSPSDLASLEGFDLPGSPFPSGDFANTSGDVNIEENNEGIPYAYPFYIGRGFNCGLHPQRIENEVCTIVVDYTDQVIIACGTNCKGNSKTLREWTILDWCSATVINWSQLIKAIDHTPPTMAVKDITISVDPWGCKADALLPVPEFIHDDCDETELSYTVSNLEGINVSGDMANGFVAHDLPRTKPGEPITMIYQPMDCCGNVGMETMTITVIDKTAPVPITLEHVVLSLTTLGTDTSGIAKIFAKDIDNGSFDACGEVHLEIRRQDDVCGFPGNTTFNNDGHSNDDVDDMDGGNYVKFCCDDLEDDGSGVLSGTVDVMLRVWDDADMDGVFGSAGDNFNESWSSVYIEDKLGSNAGQCPPNVVLDCDMNKDDLSLTGGYPGPTITTCSSFPTDSTFTDEPRLKRSFNAPELNLIVGAEVQPFDPVCRVGAIARDWSCGTQWIIFIDNDDEFDPSSIVYPEDQFLDCMEFTVGEPSWDPVSCQLIGFSVESDTFNFESGACFTVLNYFTVINWCEYDPLDSDLNSIDESTDDGLVPGIWTWTQSNHLTDTQSPSLEFLSENIYNGNVDCESEDISLQMVSDDNGDCPSPWLKWEIAVDLWGDNVIDMMYSSYLAPTDPNYIAPSARGELITITIPEGISVSTVDHLVYMTVSDGCGNVTSLLETFTVVDTKKPTPYCLNLSTALMSNGEVELWACDFNAGSFDNCTPQDYLRYTFSEINPDTLNTTVGTNEIYDPAIRCSGRIFTDADLAGADQDGVIQVPIYVWDEYGNFDFCNVNLRLEDNNGGRATIGGQIQTPDGRVIKDVEVKIETDLIDYPVSVMTDDDGKYSFASNPMYFNYQINSSKNDDILNGVSTLDLVMIQRHILGLSTLEDAYEIIAADINDDQSISALDLIELRKLVLGVYDYFPNNESWRFMQKSQAMNANYPWPFTEEISIAALEQDRMDENYTGVKIGDVNGSVVLISSGQTTEQRTDKLQLEYKPQNFLEGDEVSIAVSSPNFKDILGFQFGIQTPVLQLLRIESNTLQITSDHWNQRADGSIAVSWNSDFGISINPYETVLTLVFDALDSGHSSSLVLNSSGLTAEAYQGPKLKQLGINLQLDNEQQNELYQNEPNPFTDMTTIAFELDKSGLVEFTITDIAGRTLKSIVAHFDAGYNQLELTADELGVTGVVYYSLKNENFKATRKMVVIN